MTTLLSKADLKKIYKFEDIFEQLISGEQTSISITRLLSIKSLCKDKVVRQRYCLYLYHLLAERLLDAQEQMPMTDELQEIYKLMKKVYGFSLNDLETPENEQQIKALFVASQAYQNEMKRFKSKEVRMLKNSDLLTVEYLMACLLSDDKDAQGYIYYATRNYVEKYNPSIGTGLITDSIPNFEQILVFWRGMTGEWNLEDDCF